MKVILACFLFLFQLSSLRASASELGQEVDLTRLSETFQGPGLYQRIFNELNTSYEQIGQKQAQNILLNNKLTVNGGLNSVGLAYHRPFGEFSIQLDKNLAPDLVDDSRWIVTDTFSVYIDAYKVMQNLRSQKLIELDETVMSAFVGIEFKRTFTWVHFSKTYEEGLTTHFEKLFFPFRAFSKTIVFDLPLNEMIFKEDSLSVSGGGAVAMPLYPGLGAKAQAFASFKQLSRFEALSMPGDRLLLSLEKTKLKEASLSVSIESLLFKVIKITLLSYDFDYQYQSSYKIYTDFNRFFVQSLSSAEPAAIEINHLMAGKQVDLPVLAPFIISEEKRQSQKISSAYNFLFFSGKRVSQTEEIEIAKNGQVKTFFRHYYEKVKSTENFIAGLFFKMLSSMPLNTLSAPKLSYELKRVEIEYEGVRNLLEDHGNIDVESNKEALSLKFSAEFMTRKNSERARLKAKLVLESYSGVDPVVGEMLKRGTLMAPIFIQGHYQVNTEGILHLNSLSVSGALDLLAALCDDRPRNKFFSFRSLFDHCRHSLENDYMDYYKDITHQQINVELAQKCFKSSERRIFFSAGKKRAFIKNCLDKNSLKVDESRTVIPLWTLKNLTQNIVTNATSKVHFYNLFGVSNVFFYGSIEAQSENHMNTISYFHEGGFKNFGSVDHYMRQENLKSQSSLILNP